MRRKGFTLVELMIVVALIAIIGGGAVGIMGRNSSKAKYARIEKDLDVLQAAFTQTILSMGASFDCPSAPGSYVCLFFPDLPAATKTVMNSYLAIPVENLRDPIRNDYYRMRIEGSPAGGGHGIITIYAYGYYANPYNNNATCIRSVYNNP
jgi:prepilin-type N-terminal cleavage/methylation domain-containing protein